jgi:hypothetical protein
VSGREGPETNERTKFAEFAKLVLRVF